MANVTFNYGTTTPTSSNLAAGGIYFNTSTKKIYVRPSDATTVYEFNGNDTNTTYTYSSFPQLNNITSKYVSGTMNISAAGATYAYEGSTKTTITGIVTGFSPGTNVTSISGNFDTSNGNTTVTIKYQSNSTPSSWITPGANTSYNCTIYYIPSQA